MQKHKRQRDRRRRENVNLRRLYTTKESGKIRGKKTDIHLTKRINLNGISSTYVRN